MMSQFRQGHKQVGQDGESKQELVGDWQIGSCRQSCKDNDMIFKTRAIRQTTCMGARKFDLQTSNLAST